MIQLLISWVIFFSIDFFDISVADHCVMVWENEEIFFHEKITGKMETLEITMLGDLLWDIQPTRFALSPPAN